MAITKYNESMTQDLIVIFERGGDRQEFCDKYDIDLRTFTAWVKKRPEFSAAYKAAKIKSKETFSKLISGE